MNFKGLCLCYAFTGKFYDKEPVSLFRLKQVLINAGFDCICWYSQKNLVGMYGPLPKTFTLFMTKSINFFMT